jgi:acyl carrier protein
MNIETTILKIISKVSSAGISDIHLESYFINDLNFTAFEFVEMLNLIEQEFNIKFSAFEEPHIHTVDDIIKQVRLKLQ